MKLASKLERVLRKEGKLQHTVRCEFCCYDTWCTKLLSACIVRCIACAMQNLASSSIVAPKPRQRTLTWELSPALLARYLGPDAELALGVGGFPAPGVGGGSGLMLYTLTLGAALPCRPPANLPRSYTLSFSFLSLALRGLDKERGGLPAMSPRGPRCFRKGYRLSWNPPRRCVSFRCFERVSELLSRVWLAATHQRFTTQPL